MEAIGRIVRPLFEWINGPGAVEEDNVPEIPDFDVNTEDKLTLLKKLVGAIDQDPQTGPKFLDDLENMSKDTPFTMDMLVIKAHERSQVNPVSDLTFGMRIMLYLIAFAQSGKTNSMMFIAWKAGVEMSMPCFMYVFSKDGEGKRMDESANDFNDIVTRCANILSMDVNDYPVLKFFDSKITDDGKLFRDAIKEGYDKYIPVYTVMGNKAGVKKSHGVITKISKHLDRDGMDELNEHGNSVQMGAMKALMIIDEAELFIQKSRIVRVRDDQGVMISNTVYGGLQSEANSPITIKNKVTDSRTGVITHVPVTRDSIFDCFTTIVNVTATPQAFPVSDTKMRHERVIDVKVPVPSKNYWSYVNKASWECKIISRQIASCWTRMVTNMVTDPSPRHGLVCISSRQTGTAIIEQQEDLALRAAIDNPTVLAISWCGKKVVVYTSNNEWRSRLVNTVSFEVAEVGTSRDGNTICKFSSRPTKKNELEWDPVTKTVDRRYISSYRGLMSFIYTFGDNAPHTVLFAFKMAMRCTPIKGHNHKGALTDMYANLGVGNDESRQQMLGRLNGIDLRPQEAGKTLWGPSRELKSLVEGFKRLPYFVDKIRSGESLPDLTEEATEEVNRSPGVYMDTNQIMEVSGNAHTRGGINRRLLGEKRKFKEALDETDTVLSRVRYESEYSSPVIPIAHSVAAAVVDPDVPMISVNPTVEEAWDAQKVPISRGMNKVVEDAGDIPVTIEIMADRLDGECHFINSNGFTMNEFVNTICVKEDVLERAGLKFEEEIFSLSTTSSTKIYVTRSGVKNGLKRHFDDCVSAYRSNGFSGWVSRSDLIRTYAPDNFQVIKGRMSDIEKCGTPTLSDDHGFMMKKAGRGKEIFVKIQ